MKKHKLFALPLLTMMMLASCGETKVSTPETTTSAKPTESVKPSESKESRDPAKLDFTEAAFSGMTVTYDGNGHILDEVTGVPEGTKITYQGRESKVDVGSYEATALLEKEGYNSKTLRATLTITPRAFDGLAYNSVSTKYDGKEHINDVQLVGVLPEGTTVKETVTDGNDVVVKTAVEVGTYNYQAVIENKNYKTLTLTATLTIKAEQKDMPVFAASDGTIYFANGLHNRYLYSLSGSETKLIDYSAPKEFSRDSDSTALFIAGSTFLNSVKEVKDGATNVLYTDGNIDDFVKASDSVYYYSCNSIKSSKSGIYKVDATDTDAEPTVTKVFEGKTDQLAIYDGNLFFTNGNDKNHLYKMNLSSLSTSEVLNDKVHEYVIDNNRLYCTINGALNDYIGYIDLSGTSTEATKLTDNAGEFLNINNGYLYYNYTDLFGHIDESRKGLYRINISSKTEAQILQTNSVNGFDVEDTNSLVYIDTNDLHLYRYNIATHGKTDLLKNFVAPETTPINRGGKTYAVGNKVYYLNQYADKTLFVYDETTKRNSQLTANKVQDFFIYGDTLYFNQVTMMTNNDLYSVDIKVGSEAEKLNSNDTRNMYCDGTYIYATHYNWAGVAGGIARMKLDGTDYVKFSDINGAKNFAIKNNKLYFINCQTGQDNGYIETYDTSNITATSKELKSTRLSDDLKNVKQFEFDGDNLFYIYNGTIENSIRRTTLSGLGKGTAIASSKTNPSEFILHGNDVYYYSYAATSASDAGFYKVSKYATADKTFTLLHAYESKYYAMELSFTDSGNLYFTNYIAKLLLGDAHFYQLNTTSKDITKIM